MAVEYLDLAGQIPALRAAHFSLIISLLLVVYVFVRRHSVSLLSSPQVQLLAIILALTLGGVLHAFVRTNSFELFQVLLGYFFWLIIAYALLDSLAAVRKAFAFFVITHVLLVVVNFHNFIGTTRTEEFVGGYFLRDGNDFAWAVNVVIPFAAYFFLTTQSRVMKLLWVSAFLTLVVAVFGTQSRGATLAFAGGMLYYWWVISHHKVRGAIAITVVMIGVLALAPERYFERMETLRSYETESSAMGRLKAWKAATNMALDHPILGVGAGNFNSAYGRVYRPPEDSSRKWISAHSIYFIVLGEYGFLGLFLLLGVLFANFRMNHRSRLLLVASETSHGALSTLPGILNMSLVSFAIGGMFLGGVNYPHLFLLTAMTVAVHDLIRKHVSGNGASGNANLEAKGQSGRRARRAAQPEGAESREEAKC